MTAPTGTQGQPIQPFATGRALQRDLLASVVVFLVALPLCMGISLASGAPIASGLITGIVGGIVVGLLAGSPLQVSGPAAGLSVIIFGLVTRFGYDAIGVLVLLAGLFQLTAAFCGLARWFRAVSPAVIHGMLAGIGVLIFASQFHVMVDDRPRGSGLRNLASIPEALRLGLPWPAPSTQEQRAEQRRIGLEFSQFELQQVEIAAGTEAALRRTDPEERAQAVAAWGRKQASLQADLEFHRDSDLASAFERQPERHDEFMKELSEAAAVLSAASEAFAQWSVDAGEDERLLESVRAALASLKATNRKLLNHDWAAKLGLLTILLIVVWKGWMPAPLQVIPAPLVAVVGAAAAAQALALPVQYVNVPDSLIDGIRWPSWDTVARIPVLELLGNAAFLAVVASAETLLCATAVDQMHRGPRTNYDRELLAQGVGNSICGLLGALPMTGVIVRSAANVQAGAQTRMSAVLHGVWLLAFVVVLTPVLRMIPVASLAGLLVYTGYKLAEPKVALGLWKRFGVSELLIFLATVVVIVAEDLLMGVAVGIILSALKLLILFGQLDCRIERKDGRTDLHLSGAATFLRLPQLAEELERVPTGTELHVNLQELTFIDSACLEMLVNWAKQHEATGGRLVVDWEKLHATFRRENGRAHEAGAAPADSATHAA